MKLRRFLVFCFLINSSLFLASNDQYIIEPIVENIFCEHEETTENIQLRSLLNIKKNNLEQSQCPIHVTRLFPERKKLPQDPQALKTDSFDIEPNQIIDQLQEKNAIKENQNIEDECLTDNLPDFVESADAGDFDCDSNQNLDDNLVNLTTAEKDRQEFTEDNPEFAVDADIENDGTTRACICPARQIYPNFIGATLNDTLSFPPDSMGAIGPNQYILACNGRIRSFNKATGTADGVINVTANQFFESVRAGGRTTDPRIRYDFHTKRWFVVMINIATPNRILIAVSNTGNITKSTVWRFFAIGMQANEFADFPTLGIDRNALYIGVNIFGGLTGGFRYSAAFVVPKSSILSTGPIRAFGFRNLSGVNGMLTPQGVDNYDSSSRGYFIGTSSSSWGRLVIREVLNPTTTPTLSAGIQLTVPATAYPIPVPHKGDLSGPRGYVDSVDDRLTSSHIRKGFLCTAHNIGVNNSGVSSGTLTRTGSRWYKIDVRTAGKAALVQSGTLYNKTTTNANTAVHYWMPSVMTNGKGDLTLGCSFAGSNSYIHSAFRIKYANNTGITFNKAYTLAATSAVYSPSYDRGTPRRWGDYSHTSLDPSDNMSMWTIQEYCHANNSYAVRVARILAPPPATPVRATPSTVKRQTTPINVTITGTSSGGSAFYDPGSGFECRLKAVVSGGVRVNSVRYVNPTTVVLNITTSAATVGLKTVTITNPDCQSKSGAILRIS